MTVQQKSFRVLVIGDACTDQYYMCRNTRLNPESSAPLVQVTSTYLKEGMSGNVAYGFKELGIKTRLVQPDKRSIKTRYVNAVTKEQLLRVDFDPKVDKLIPDEIDSILFSHLYDAVVISDYDKGFLGYDTINYIVGMYDGPVFLDTKKKGLEQLNPRIFIKINEHEANAATKVPDHAIVTLGAAGVQWFNERWPALKSQSVDVCGAGDAFMVGMVYGYLQNEGNMIDYGTVNAGLSVRHSGTYSPSLQELNQGLDEYYKQCRKN